MDTYEKKYNELVAKLKKASVDNDWCDERFCCVINSLFPELAESEDEKIRKELIKETKGSEVRLFEAVTNDEFVAWLEKQAEQKPFDYEHANIPQNDSAPKKAMEAIKKEKPKFDIGAWVVWQNQCYKVNYNGCGYELIDQNGLSTSLEYGTVDNSAHLWTIEDAKDGDILASNKSIFIFQEEYIGEKPIAYCGLMNGLFIEGNNTCWTNEKCYPATKEQRDLLFQKMKEAGYEWDAEKKELNKIQQQPIDKVEPKFKVGDIIKPKDGGHEPWQIMQVDILDKKYRFKEGYVIHFSQEDNYELVKQNHKVTIKIYDSVPYEDDLSGVTHQQDGDSYIVEYEGTRAQGGTTLFNHLFVYIFAQEFTPPYPAMAPWHWKDVGKFTGTDGKNADDGVDKVESKFKTGDWVVSPNGVYWHVDAIRDGRYQVSSNSGESADWPLDTNIYHRFTFRDAKDGDVLLSSDGSIFIFKEVVDLGCKHYIALEEEDGTIQVNDNFAHCWESVFGICPATKEQRDTLEKAMADAGYTFDFEKKELNKIEDKPLVIDEGKAEIDRCFTEMMSEYDTKQKPASEEDERMIDRVKESLNCFIDCVEENTDLEDDTRLSLIGNVKNEIKWVESLKDKTKWKPNTEDNKPSIKHSVLMKTVDGIAEGEWQGNDIWYQYRWCSRLKDSDVLAWMELSDLMKE